MLHKCPVNERPLGPVTDAPHPVAVTKLLLKGAVLPCSPLEEGFPVIWNLALRETLVQPGQGL